MLRSILAGTALVGASGAMAMTGGQLVEAANLDPRGTALMAYLHGVGDMNAVNKLFDRDGGPITFCMPPGADYKQAGAIAITALRASPAEWHTNALNVVLPALARAWPCSGR